MEGGRTPPVTTFWLNSWVHQPGIHKYHGHPWTKHGKYADRFLLCEAWIQISTLEDFARYTTHALQIIIIIIIIITTIITTATTTTTTTTIIIIIIIIDDQTIQFQPVTSGQNLDGLPKSTPQQVLKDLTPARYHRLCSLGRSSYLHDRLFGRKWSDGSLEGWRSVYEFWNWLSEFASVNFGFLFPCTLFLGKLPTCHKDTMLKSCQIFRSCGLNMDVARGVLSGLQIDAVISNPYRCIQLQHQ